VRYDRPPRARRVIEEAYLSQDLQDLLQRPELLSTLLANMQDGLTIIDARGTVIYCNDALCELVGFSRAELLGATPPFPYWPAEELTNINTAFQRTMRGDMDNFELIYQRKNGTRVEVIVAPAALHDATGNVIAYFATVKDISERKRLERSLQESEQRWRSVAENPYDFVVLIDRNYKYTYVNHTAPGITQESLLGRATPFDFVDASYHDVMRTSIDTTFATGRSTHFEAYSPQLNTWYSTIVGAVVENDAVTAVSMLTRDITIQKQAEETLQRSEQRLRETHKMETIGTLAGGIAHDINNMLTPILANADLAKQKLPADHPVHAHLHGIVTGSKRARELVNRLLLFSRRQEPQKTQFDLRSGIREDVVLMSASLPSHVRLVTDLPEDAVNVFADRAQIGQVITNLATNALQAMHGIKDGQLTVTLSRTTDADGKSFAEVTVHDTGPGMDDVTMRRIFEPFFTTKPVGSGTGLGLSIVHGVIRDHGGETQVRSVLGKGSTFTIRLPALSVANPVEAKSMPETTVHERPSARVLVVDDEESIVEVAYQTLKRAGHVVTTFISPRAALECFARAPHAFDVLITDQSMPGMKGLTLIAEVRALRPSLPCLLITGLCDEALQRDARAVGVAQVIAKPFSLSSLVEAVEKATTDTVRDA
jgi:PAS domain S-box-containing protein